MVKKKTIDVEIWDLQFSSFKLLSKNDVQSMNKKRDHIRSLSSMLTIIALLLVFTLLIDNYKYSEYVLLLIGLITIITTSYIVISKINTKKSIKRELKALILSKYSQDRYKIKIYYRKFLDRAEIISVILIYLCSLIALIRSIFLIIGHI